MERLKGFEETQLLELLDLTSEDIVARFKDIIYNRREYLYGEIEMLANSVDDEELDFDTTYDGFTIEEGDMDGD